MSEVILKRQAARKENPLLLSPTNSTRLVALDLGESKLHMRRKPTPKRNQRKRRFSIDSPALGGGANRGEVQMGPLSLHSPGSSGVNQRRRRSTMEIDTGSLRDVSSLLGGGTRPTTLSVLSKAGSGSFKGLESASDEMTENAPVKRAHSSHIVFPATIPSDKTDLAGDEESKEGESKEGDKPPKKGEDEMKADI